MPRMLIILDIIMLIENKYCENLGLKFLHESTAGTGEEQRFNLFLMIFIGLCRIIQYRLSTDAVEKYYSYLQPADFFIFRLCVY